MILSLYKLVVKLIVVTGGIKMLLLLLLLLDVPCSHQYRIAIGEDGSMTASYSPSIPPSSFNHREASPFLHNDAHAISEAARCPITCQPVSSCQLMTAQEACNLTRPGDTGHLYIPGSRTVEASPHIEVVRIETA